MFKILDEVCTPKRGTKYSAYVDLFAREDVVIGAGETKVVPLGIKIDLEEFRKAVFRNLDSTVSYFTKEHQDRIFDRWIASHYLEVALRSSLAVKGLIIGNGIGIIDLDYPDEIGLIVHNPVKAINIASENWAPEYKLNGEYVYISKGDKVAQCTIKEHKGYLMGYESDVIRDGGYGSTGK